MATNSTTWKDWTTWKDYFEEYTAEELADKTPSELRNLINQRLQTSRMLLLYNRIAGITQNCPQFGGYHHFVLEGEGVPRITIENCVVMVGSEDNSIVVFDYDKNIFLPNDWLDRVMELEDEALAFAQALKDAKVKAEKEMLIAQLLYPVEAQ